MSLIQLLFRQQVPMVRELVCIAGAGGIIFVLRAGLTGRVEELHELSETVGNLGKEKGRAHPSGLLTVNGRAPTHQSETSIVSSVQKKRISHTHTQCFPVSNKTTHAQ